MGVMVRRSAGTAGILVAAVSVTAGIFPACGAPFSTCEELRTCRAPASGGEGGAFGGEGGAFGGEGGGSGEEGGTAGAQGGMAGDGAGTGGSGQPPCDDGRTRCGGDCIDPEADEAFCGASGDCSGDRAGEACSEDEECQAGACTSTDARLESLTISSATLTPDFDPDVTSYVVKHALLATELRVSASPMVSSAAMQLDDAPFTSDDRPVLIPAIASLGDDPLSAAIEVTAPSGAKRTYELDFVPDVLEFTYAKAFENSAGYRFGTSVAIDGDRIVIGAPGEDTTNSGVDGTGGEHAAPDSGAAYVFERESNGDWSPRAYLKASVPSAGALFGSSVAIQGDTLVVGAPGADMVYVFGRNDTTWAEQDALLGLPQLTQFGISVALAGDTIAVGAPLLDAGDDCACGTVVIFTHFGLSWFRSSLAAPSAVSGAEDRLGDRVVMSGDYLAATFAGHVAIARRTESGWKWEDEVGSDLGAPVTDIALDGDTLIAGAGATVASYRRQGDDDWGEATPLADLGDFAAGGTIQVALSGDFLAAASPCDGCARGVRTFVRRNGTFVRNLDVRPVPTFLLPGIGASLAVGNGRVVAGSPLEDSEASGLNGDFNGMAAPDSGAAFIID